MILPAAARTYVVVGTVDVHVPIPPGYSVVGLACGRPPKRLSLPREAAELTVEGVEWDLLSEAAMQGLPAVLLVVPRENARAVAAMSQRDADALHAEVIIDWARGTSDGEA